MNKSRRFLFIVGSILIVFSCISLGATGDVKSHRKLHREGIGNPASSRLKRRPQGDYGSHFSFENFKQNINLGPNPGPGPIQQNNLPVQLQQKKQELQNNNNVPVPQQRAPQVQIAPHPPQQQKPSAPGPQKNQNQQQFQNRQLPVQNSNEKQEFHIEISEDGNSKVFKKHQNVPMNQNHGHQHNQNPMGKGNDMNFNPGQILHHQQQQQQQQFVPGNVQQPNLPFANPNPAPQPPQFHPAQINGGNNNPSQSAEAASIVFSNLQQILGNTGAGPGNNNNGNQPQAPTFEPRHFNTEEHQQFNEQHPQHLPPIQNPNFQFQNNPDLQPHPNQMNGNPIGAFSTIFNNNGQHPQGINNNGNDNGNFINNNNSPLRNFNHQQPHPVFHPQVTAGHPNLPQNSNPLMGHRFNDQGGPQPQHFNDNFNNNNEDQSYLMLASQNHNQNILPPGRSEPVPARADYPEYEEDHYSDNDHYDVQPHPKHKSKKELTIALAAEVAWVIVSSYIFVFLANAAVGLLGKWMGLSDSYLETKITLGKDGRHPFEHYGNKGGSSGGGGYPSSYGKPTEKPYTPGNHWYHPSTGLYDHPTYQYSEKGNKYALLGFDQHQAVKFHKKYAKKYSKKAGKYGLRPKPILPYIPAWDYGSHAVNLPIPKPGWGGREDLNTKLEQPSQSPAASSTVDKTISKLKRRRGETADDMEIGQVVKKYDDDSDYDSGNETEGTTITSINDNDTNSTIASGEDTNNKDLTSSIVFADSGNGTWTSELTSSPSSSS